MQLAIPPPLCTRCRKLVDELRVEPAPESGGLRVTATCHGATETTILPYALAQDVHFGRARLLQGEAFREPE